jgi:hypothetical protein
VGLAAPVVVWERSAVVLAGVGAPVGGISARDHRAVEAEGEPQHQGSRPGVVITTPGLAYRFMITQ